MVAGCQWLASGPVLIWGANETPRLRCDLADARLKIVEIFVNPFTEATGKRY